MNVGPKKHTKIFAWLCYITVRGVKAMGEKTPYARSLPLPPRTSAGWPKREPEKSAVAKHCINTGHRIRFSNTTVLDKTTGCMDRLVKEANEIRLNSCNLKTHGFFSH